jgi:hypothetical protein
VNANCGCGEGLPVLSLLPPGPRTALHAFVCLLPNCSREDTCLPTSLIVPHGNTTWPPCSTIDLGQCSFMSNRWTCLVLQLSKQDCSQHLECHPYLPVCCPFSIAGWLCSCNDSDEIGSFCKSYEEKRQQGGKWRTCHAFQLCMWAMFSFC